MASVDDRIVRMEFDNAAFEKKLQTTLNSLSQLDKALKFDGASKGLTDVSAAANKVDLSRISQGIDNISQKFSAMGAIGLGVILSLTESATHFIGQLGQDILGPIISGGTARAKNIEQAKFMFEGLGIDIAGAMQNALDAVKGTAFGLDEAAKAAAQFGASGIQVGTQMTAALRGVAGAAALTGKSFTEIADIFAGSAGSGKVTNIDLQQFATRGLNAAAAIGKVMGKTEAQIHEMAAAGDLDFQTFADAMDKAFGAHATEANKTYAGSLANLHAAMSRLGAAFITPQLTNFRDIFNTLSPIIDNFTSAISPLITTFTGLSKANTTAFIGKLNSISFDSLKAAIPSIQAGMINISNTLHNIATIISQAFHEIFPPGSLSIVVKMGEAFQKLTEFLILGSDGWTNLTSIFRIFFSTLSIGWNVIKEGAKFIADLSRQLLSLVSPGVGGFLTKLADGFVHLQDVLVKQGGIAEFFAALTIALQKPIAYLKQFRDALGRVFGLFDHTVPDAVSDSFGRLSDRFQNVKDTFQKVAEFFAPIENAFNKVKDTLGNIFDALSSFFSDLGGKVADLLNKGDFSGVFDAINTGLLAGITLLLVKFLKNGFNIDIQSVFGVSGGFFDAITNTFGQLTDTLKAMQTEIKADALLKIASAIAILTASVTVLSLIDSEALAKALAAMAVGFGQLMASFAVLSQLANGPKSAASFGILSAGLILLSSAILILSLAAAALAQLSWEELARGLAGVTALLGILIVTAKPLAADSKSMITAGVGVTAMAVALTVLAVAMKIFATMSWEEIAKGLASVGALLLGIAGFMALLPPSPILISEGIALVAVATALTLLAVAVKAFSTMSWEELAKGLASVGILLLGLAGFMALLPPGPMMISEGLAILGLAIAMNVLAVAMKIFATMSWEEIAKGLVTIAVALGVIVLAMNLMEGALPGAAALLIVSFALGVLAGVLKVFQTINFTDLLESLGKMGLALLAIAIAADAISESIPVILALGIALSALGAAFALFGAGMFLLGKGLESIAKFGGAASEQVVKILENVGKAIPSLLAGLAKGMVEMLKVLETGIPLLVKVLGELLAGLLDEISKLIPKVGPIIVQLVEEIFKIIRSYAGELIDTGLFIIMKLLHGIEDNIGPITETVGNIIVNFLAELNKQIPRITQGLVDVFTTAMTSAANALGQVAATLMVGTGIAFMEGFFQGLQQALGPVGEWLADIGNKVIGFVGDVFNTLVQAGEDIINGFWQGIQNVWGEVTGFFSDVRNTIFSNFSDAFNWLKDAGEQVVSGFWQGIKNIWGNIVDWVKRHIDDLIHTITHPWEIFSPSHLMRRLGENIMEGWLVGLQNGFGDVDSFLTNLSATDTVESMANNMSNALSGVVDQMSNLPEFNPVITPVLDLTQVAKDASTINGFIENSKLAPSFSLDQASTILRDQRAQQDSVSTPATNESQGVMFEQNIYSPTQLSVSDIYKATRNQIRIAKEELSIP